MRVAEDVEVGAEPLRIDPRRASRCIGDYGAGDEAPSCCGLRLTRSRAATDRAFPGRQDRVEIGVGTSGALRCSTQRVAELWLGRQDEVAVPSGDDHRLPGQRRPTHPREVAKQAPHVDVHVVSSVNYHGSATPRIVDAAGPVANASQIVALDRSVLDECTGKLPRTKLELILSGLDIVLGR